MKQGAAAIDPEKSPPLIDRPSDSVHKSVSPAPRNLIKLTTLMNLST